MAAKKKKKKAKKAPKAVKAPVAQKKTAKKKKAPAKKAKAKKPMKKAKPAAKKKAVKAAPKKTAKKKPAKKKKQIVGEGDYAATRAFDKAEAAFVKKNKANIPAMGKAAEAALDGPQGDMLRDAEAAAAGRSRDTF